MTQYGPSIVVGDDAHQALAPGFPIGKRFKSVEVVRVCDGNVVHLGHHARADGRWRVYVFADTAPASRRRACARVVGAGDLGGVDGLGRVAARTGTRRKGPTSTPCST